MPTVTDAAHHRVALEPRLLDLRIHPYDGVGTARYVEMRICRVERDEIAVEHVAEPVPRSNPCGYMTPFRELLVVQRERIKARSDLQTPPTRQHDLHLQVRRQYRIVQQVVLQRHHLMLHRVLRCIDGHTILRA